MAKKPKQSVNPPQQHSAWPHLFSNRAIASRGVADDFFILFLEDIKGHRAVNAERLIHIDEVKNQGLGMKLRGAISALDFILELPQAVEQWKKSNQ